VPLEPPPASIVKKGDSMRVQKHWIYPFMFLLALTTYADQGKREKLLGYNKIELAPFRNKVGDTLDEKTITETQAMIIQKINESKLFSADINKDLTFPKKDPDDDNKVMFPGTSKDDDDKTIVLFGEIITFNKGSRAKRYLVGGGTGRAEMRANCYLVDKKTGKQFYNFQTFGETNWGAFGGGGDKTAKGMANRLVDFLKGK
jgi:hypothetical protein